MRTCTLDGCERKHLSRGHCSKHYYSVYVREQSRWEYTCDQCGKQYAATRQLKTETHYCSWQCQRQSIAKDRQINLKCKQCGKDFTSTAAQTKYCSDECRHDAKPKREPKDLRSPLRRAYEEHDHKGVIEALRNKATITESGCWEWPSLDSDRYPRANFGNKHYPLHRLSLEAKYGKPLGSQAAHHMCANTKCVNPEHLQPVTARDNTAEMIARQSYLKRIHELEDELRKIDPGNKLLNVIEYT